MKFNKEINLTGVISVAGTLIVCIAFVINVAVFQEAQATINDDAKKEFDKIELRLDEQEGVKMEIGIIKNDMKHMLNSIERIADKVDP